MDARPVRLSAPCATSAPSHSPVPASSPHSGLRSHSIVRFGEGGPSDVEDALAVEAPLEIRLSGPSDPEQPLTITMRTPGQDAELALGYLFAEGLLGSRHDILSVEQPHPSQVVVRYKGPVPIARENEKPRWSRSSPMASACGVCGKTSLDGLRYESAPVADVLPPIRASLLEHLARQAWGRQTLFEATGGVHAAALFDAGGSLLSLHEDVGRHNAVDKVLGSLLLRDQLPAATSMLFLSGRIGYELVQKAAAAGIPLLAAMGAPSSLAVDTAQACAMTLVGFLKPHRFNVYSAPHRIQFSST